MMFLLNTQNMCMQQKYKILYDVSVEYTKHMCTTENTKYYDVSIEYTFVVYST